MSLKDSEAYHRPTGSKYLVGSSSVPYCNRRYPTHMLVMDARTQQVSVDQLFSAPKCVRLVRMSVKSYDLLTKIIRAVPKKCEGELQDVVGEEFMRLSEDNVSEDNVSRRRRKERYSPNSPSWRKRRMYIGL